MFLHRAFLLCALMMLIAVITNIRADEESDEKEVAWKENEEESGDARNPAIALRILMQVFKWAATHCLKEAAGQCQQHWRNPRALTRCAGSFLAANKGRCALG